MSNHSAGDIAKESIDPDVTTSIAQPLEDTTHHFDPNVAPTHLADSALSSQTTKKIEIPGYRILGELGRGGMGMVYRAKQVRADRLVALKVMLNVAHAKPEEVERFHIEVQAAGKLQHPNIVQVYDVGQVDELPYFTQEYVSGGTLSQKIANQLLGHQETATAMMTLSKAIAYAHGKGIIHRDLKPSNILIAEDGGLKIADFGLARRTEDQSHLTRDGMIVGTPSYMAPEQAYGSVHEIGPLCDVYSLGAILYELLTGRPPFKGASVWEVINLVRSSEPNPPSTLRPDTPKDLETICLKCLQKDPAKRYTSATALAEDLQRHLNHEPILARPIGQWERLLRLCRRHPREATLASVLASVLVLFTIGASWAALKMAYQRDQIASEKKTSDQRLSLYKDTVSTFVNAAPQSLDGVPFADGFQKELRGMIGELLSSSDTSTADVGPSQQWALAGVAIRQGDMLVKQAELLLRQGSDQSEASSLLTDALNEFERAEQSFRSVLERGEGDRAKGLSNLALSLSQQAVAKRLIGDHIASEDLYRQAIALRQQAADLPLSEKDPLQRLAELGREYTNLTELQFALAKVETEPQLRAERLAESRKSAQIAVDLLREAVDGPKAKEYPPKANAIRDRMLACELAASICVEQRMFENADPYYAEGLLAAQRAVEMEPTRFSHRLGLIKFSASYGDYLLMHAKDPAAARTKYVVSMLQLREIFSNDAFLNLQEDGLAMGYYRLGLASVGQGNQEQARKYFERCALIRDLDLRQRSDSAAARANPDVLLGARIGLMLANARSGNTQEAVDEAHRLIERALTDPPPEGPIEPYLMLQHAAATLGILSEQLTDPDKEVLLAEAVATIRKSIEFGFSDRQHLMTDPDLQPLQRSPEFEQLQSDLEK
ncbi:MAG: serine/threonine protein kinase [Pirellula sp.]|jgi:serine/threonine protein kinase|nr:serine/threonine protein kinase [Pirellula sp.]